MSPLRRTTPWRRGGIKRTSCSRPSPRWRPPRLPAPPMKYSAFWRRPRRGGTGASDGRFLGAAKAARVGHEAERAEGFGAVLPERPRGGGGSRADACGPSQGRGQQCGPEAQACPGERWFERWSRRLRLARGRFQARPPVGAAEAAEKAPLGLPDSRPPASGKPRPPGPFLAPDPGPPSGPRSGARY